MSTKHFKKIYIEITNVCNLRCSFCSESKQQRGFMPIDRFAEIVEKIRIHTDYIYLHVKGEPLLHPKLSAMLDLCHDKKLWVNLVTNGTLLPEKDEMLLYKPALRQVNISLHCFSELTLFKNKDDYTKAVVDFTHKALLQTNIITSLRFWNMTKGESEHSVDNQRILHEIEREFAPNLDLEQTLKPGTGLKLRDRLYVNSDFEFSWPSLADDYDELKGFCYGLRDQLAILNDGTVVPCCLDAEGIINLGNIFEQDVQQIIDSDRAQKIYDGFSNSTRVELLCRKCRFKQKVG